MSDAANSSIPLEIRQQFPCDDHGRVLWFTTPPLNITPAPSQLISPKDGKPLAHTPEYLAAKEKRSKLIAERKQQIQERMKAAAQTDQTNDDINDSHQSPKRRRKATTVTEAQVDHLVLQTLTDQILNANLQWYKSQHGDRAAEVEAYDALRAAERRKAAEAKEAYLEERKRVEVERREKEKGMEGKVFRDDWGGT